MLDDLFFWALKNLQTPSVIFTGFTETRPSQIHFVDPVYGRYHSQKDSISWMNQTATAGVDKMISSSGARFKMKILIINVIDFLNFPCHFLGSVLPAPALNPCLAVFKTAEFGTSLHSKLTVLQCCDIVWNQS